MKAVFVELPPFQRQRSSYLTDDEFKLLQTFLLTSPEAGVIVQGTGDLRKLRYADSKRNKGKRGGLRIIYFWWAEKSQFWLFTCYNKDEMNDLTAPEKAILKAMLKAELEVRK